MTFNKEIFLRLILSLSAVAGNAAPLSATDGSATEIERDHQEEGYSNFSKIISGTGLVLLVYGGHSYLKYVHNNALIAIREKEQAEREKALVANQEQVRVEAQAAAARKQAHVKNTFMLPLRKDPTVEYLKSTFADGSEGVKNLYEIFGLEEAGKKVFDAVVDMIEKGASTVDEVIALRKEKFFKAQMTMPEQDEALARFELQTAVELFPPLFINCIDRVKKKGGNVSSMEQWLEQFRGLPAFKTAFDEFEQANPK